jgi:hypothetical protein
MVTAIAPEWVTAINSESVTAFIVINNHAINLSFKLKWRACIDQNLVASYFQT